MFDIINLFKKYYHEKMVLILCLFFEIYIFYLFNFEIILYINIFIFYDVYFFIYVLGWELENYFNIIYFIFFVFIYFILFLFLLF